MDNETIQLRIRHLGGALLLSTAKAIDKGSVNGEAITKIYKILDVLMYLLDEPSDMGTVMEQFLDMGEMLEKVFDSYVKNHPENKLPAPSEK